MGERVPENVYQIDIHPLEVYMLLIYV